MLIRILEIVFPIFAIVMVGVLYGRAYRPDMDVAGRVNLHVFIPCLVFSALVQQPLQSITQPMLLLAALLIHLLPALFILPFVKLFKEPVKLIIPPVIFANAGNLGLPLMVLAFGEQALAPAVVLFLIMNLLQFSLGVRILDREIKWLNVLRQPVLIAGFIALAYQLLELRLPTVVTLPVDMLGKVAVPLMLFMLGTSLAKARLADWRLGLVMAVLIPALGVLSAWLINLALPLDDLQQRILILYGALPPAVLTFILAQRYNQQPDKAAAIVMVGNMMAVLTIPLVLFFVLPSS